MDKSGFKKLFLDAASQAIKEASSALAMAIPPEFIVQLHGAGHPGDFMSCDKAIDALYISDTKFWQVIDVSVTDVRDGQTVLFVRSSGHEPAEFDKTRHASEGSGPFHVMTPMLLESDKK